MSDAACGQLDSLDPVRRAVFEWLVKVASCCKETAMDVGETDSNQKEWHGVLDALWHHSNSKLVAQVSLRYFDFSIHHIKFLVDKTRALEKKRKRLDEAKVEELEGTEDDGEVKRKRLDIPEEDMTMETDSQGDGGNLSPPLSEEVERVTAHWVELAQAGNRLKETCISLLSDEANLLKKHSSELTYSGHLSMRLALDQESIWTVILDKVLSASKMIKSMNQQKSTDSD